VGSKPRLSVTVWLGFNVTGKLAPDMLKPVPASVAALMVTAAVPVSVRVSDCAAAAALTFTLPKLRLPVLSVSPGTEAFNCIARLSVTLPAVAVSVAVCAVLTTVTVAVNGALLAPAATVTVAGTATALLLLPRLTARPPLPAAAFSVTVQASVPDPLIVLLLHVSPLNTANPVPLRLTTVVGLVEESLVIVS